MEKLDFISHEALCKIYNIKESSDMPYCITNYKDENNNLYFWTLTDHIKATTRILKSINDCLGVSNTTTALIHAKTNLKGRYDEQIFDFVMIALIKLNDVQNIL